MSSVTRSLVQVRNPNRQRQFTMDGVAMYSVPAFDVVQRIYNTDMTTSVYNSERELAFHLMVAVEIEVDLGAIQGKASAKVQIDRGTNRKVVLSESALSVQLYDISLGSLLESDLDPDMVLDFEALPMSWADDPLMLQAFIDRWGTHYLKKASVGGQFVQRGKTETGADQENFQIAMAVSLTMKLGVVTGSGSASVDFSRKSESSFYNNDFSYTAHGGDPEVGGMLVRLFFSF